MTDTNRPAGWYPDPSGARRWWDGTAWSAHAHPDDRIPPPRPRGARRPVAVVLVALLGLSALVAGLGWLVPVLAGGPGRQVEDFYQDLGRGRVEAAAARLCDRYADNGVAVLTAAFPEEVLNYDTDSVARTGDTAVVTGSLATGSASAYRITVQVVRERGHWKVCSLPGD